MRSDVIVIASIDTQNPAQMRLAQDDEMIHTLATDRPDQPFSEAILPRRGRCRRLVPNARGAQSACDDGAIDTIPIADQIVRRLSVPKTPSIGFAIASESEHDCWMFAITFLFVRVLCNCFKSRRRLEAEVLVLRHQLNVLQQRAPRRLYLTWIDRALFVWLYRDFPRILDAITILRPETIVRWHRKGFAAFWRWKSRALGGRPQVDKEVRDLIRRMSFENPLWGAPHIHGELLKLGFDVAQSTVSKYMVPRRDRPSQTWKTFLHNHADGIASIDLFVVPTIAFEQLFAFLVLGHGRRQLLWFAVTRHPTAGGLARQITEAFPWDKAPAYIVRDNDRAFGGVFTRRIQAMGIRDRPTSFRSPWQNGRMAMLIGSIRREYTDHLIVLNEEHLRRILAKFSAYYNGWRPHVSLGKDAPDRRPIERVGNIVAHAILGGLHHRYARI